MAYKLQFSARFDKQLKKIHTQEAKRAIKEIEKLTSNPYPKGKKVKKLVGSQAWRLRIGKVRVIYFIVENNKTIFLEDIAYRKDFY